MTKLEMLEDQIFYHSCRICECNLKLRQIEEGYYMESEKQNCEYSRNTHRETLRNMVMQWLAEYETEKLKNKRFMCEATAKQVVYGRW